MNSFISSKSFHITDKYIFISFQNALTEHTFISFEKKKKKIKNHKIKKLINKAFLIKCQFDNCLPFEKKKITIICKKKLTNDSIRVY